MENWRLLADQMVCTKVVKLKLKKKSVQARSAKLTDKKVEEATRRSANVKTTERQCTFQMKILKTCLSNKNILSLNDLSSGDIFSILKLAEVLKRERSEEHTSELQSPC